MDTSQSLSKDEIFEVLSNQRRRQLLILLHRADGSSTLGDLAESIAAQEVGEDVSSDQYKRVYISLYQTHVPKLQELGIVEYDADEKEVWLTDRFDQVVTVLGETRQPRPWWRYYAVLALVSLVYIVVYWAVLPTDELVGRLAALVPILALLVLVLVHYRSSTRETEVALDDLL